MFQHANKHIPVSNDSNKPIPPMANDHGDLVKLFLNTWPTSYDRKSIVIADPLIVNTATLQKRLLAAITSAFDLKSGGVDTRLVKRKVLDYAWSLHGICNQHSRRKKYSAENLHVQLVFFTLISIVASVLYEKIYGGVKHAKTHIQLIIYVSTIILPLYVTSLKQESNEGLAMINWASFKIAATRIESEILKFRCQVGVYRVEEKTETALQRPVQIFATKIRNILNSVSKTNLTEDSLSLPPTFWEFDAAAHMLPPKSSDDGVKAVSPPPRPAQMQVPSTIGHSGNDGISFESESIEEETPILEKTDKYGSTTEGYDEEMPTMNSKLNNIEGDDASTDSSVQFIDDKYCPIKTDDYIELRMQTAMHTKARKIEKMATRNKTINFVIKIITIGSGATAAVSLQWAVPIILGLTASLGTGQEFRSYPRRIEMGNTMVTQLNDLKLWWMSLSMYQKQLPHNKDKLVLSAEKIIVMEMESSFTSRSSADEGE